MPVVQDKASEAPACCHVVPVLGYMSRPVEVAIEGALADLRKHGSMAAPGFMQPEGIVLFHEAGKALFKITLEGDDKPKGSKE